MFAMKPVILLVVALQFTLPIGSFSCGSPPTSREETTINTEVVNEKSRRVVIGATRQLETTHSYTQDYFSIPYPNGDVPAETGACTDVVIRSFRAAGVDLQKEVHEDMRKNFAEYPKKWGLEKPDTNIDHRRVPNLQTYFSRKKKALPITERAENFLPGDVVSWDLDGKGMTHIGVVSDRLNDGKNRHLIIHNIGSGAMAEDRLFEWKITGHFRYF